MQTVDYTGIQSSFSWCFLDQFCLCVLGELYILHVLKKEIRKPLPVVAGDNIWYNPSRRPPMRCLRDKKETSSEMILW